MILGIYFKKKEFLFPVVLAFLAVLFSTLPVFYGYWRSNNNFKFVGFLSEPMDHNTYFSWMKQAEEGNVLFEEKYSTEKQPRNIFLLYFLTGGFISRIFKIPLPIIYQAMRIISAFILLSVSYLFIAYFIESRLARRIAFLLICFSAGLGGYFAFIYHFFKFKLPEAWIPLDQTMPEVVTFWTVSWIGHASLGISFILLAFLFMLYSIEQNKIKFCLLAGLSCFIIGLFHPYHIVTISVVLGVYIFFLFIKRDSTKLVALRNYILMLLVTFPGIWLQYYTAQTNPIVKEWSNIVYPPFSGPIGYIFAFGLVFFMAIFSLPYVIKKGQNRLYFLVLWVSTISVFIYYPFIFFQRHAANGIHIALCVLAAIGFLRLCQSLGWYDGSRLKSKGVILLSVFLILVLPTNLVHLAVDFRNAHIRRYPYFLSGDLIGVLNWLDKNISQDSVVLAPRNIASFIPPYTGSKVYIGHWAETLNHRQKEEIFKRFMQRDTRDEFRIALLKNEGISYFVFECTKSPFRTFNPDAKDYLKEVFANTNIKVYKVNLP